ncbi:MAG: hypothetical protein ACYDHT_12345 [Solirubrobacteraceae bacterium]
MFVTPLQNRQPPCVACGTHKLVKQVVVVPADGGEREVIALCDRCAGKGTEAVWRRRWTPIAA